MKTLPFLTALLLAACGTGVTNEHDPTAGHAAHTQSAVVDAQASADPLAPVLDAYFQLEDALVAGDSVQAPKLAVKLDGSIHNLDKKALSAGQQAEWEKVMTSLMPALHPFGVTKGSEEQRTLFAQLTPGMKRIAELATSDAPVYLLHCPMYPGGADWLSREKAVKNPFYGSAMLTCGSVKEVIGG
jgi:hypothetical protein